MVCGGSDALCSRAMQKWLVERPESVHFSRNPHLYGMRNITKIFLLIVVAFFVYLLWPRNGDLKAFKPAELAKLEVENWKAQKAGKGVDSLVARFKIYTSQYGFSPIAAYRVASAQSSALENLKTARLPNADPNDENRVLSALTEKYTWIKKQVKGSFDPDSVARDEMVWRMKELDNAPQAESLVPMTNVLAALFGGQPAEFHDVAVSLLTARGAVFGEASDVNPVETATEAYKLLKEIAQTPVTQPAE
jgi:hypothetical protein